MKEAGPQDAPDIARLMDLSRTGWTGYTAARPQEIEHSLKTGELKVYLKEDSGLLEVYHRENAQQIICMYPYRHPQAPEHMEDDLIAFAKQLSVARHIPLEISVPHTREREIEKLIAQGYVHSRTFYRMFLQGTALSSIQKPELPAGWEFRTITAQEFLPLHNDAFRTHYGFSPMTLKTVESWYSEPDFRAEDWQALFVHGKPVSYFSIGKQEDGGHVYLLGTVREAQGQGYGRIALRQACALLKDRGVDRIQLGVDTGNENALEFYKRLGFEVAYANLRYRYEPKTLTL
jgi:ribosomal protein S18 acetylase RimI-like enzyme